MAGGETSWEPCEVEGVPYRFRTRRLAAKQYVVEVGIAQPDGVKTLLTPKKHHFESRFVAAMRVRAYIQRFHRTQADTIRGK